MATPARADPATDLVSPSGDGRRGGDFQMWFWLRDAILLIEPSDLVDFATVSVGREVNRSVRLSNTGATPVTANVSVSGGDRIRTTLAKLPITLEPSGQTDIPLIFKPLQGRQIQRRTANRKRSRSRIRKPRSSCEVAAHPAGRSVRLAFRRRAAQHPHGPYDHHPQPQPPADHGHGNRLRFGRRRHPTQDIHAETRGVPPSHRVSPTASLRPEIRLAAHRDHGRSAGFAGLRSSAEIARVCFNRVARCGLLPHLPVRETFEASSPASAGRFRTSTGGLTPPRAPPSRFGPCAV